jgi:hypothetical protein
MHPAPIPRRRHGAPGVTATEIRIGGVLAALASSIGLVGRGVLAYVQSINDRGGTNGRKINYIALDDAYSPPKAVEHVRRLVESDEVAFLFSQLGTPGNSAALKYLDFDHNQQGMLLEQILKQCGIDLSRGNISTQARSLKHFVLPTALPGIKINTSATSNTV